MYTFSKNNLFFGFLVLGYVFGVMLYDFLAFNYTDELMVVFLMLFAALTVYERRKFTDLKPVFIVCIIFLFYLLYSFIISSNVPKAILKDLVIQIKPFLGFFCTLIIAPSLTKPQKRIIVLLTLIFGFILIITGLTGNIYTVFVHPSRFATAAVVTAFLFCYCSSYSTTDLLIFVVLLSIGLFSTRAKFYGFLGAAVFLIVYVKFGGQLRLNVKGIITGILAVALILWIGWGKIELYYIDGMMTSREMWSRPAMFLVFFVLLIDYFPFGTGLASFGTFASAEDYSDIYEKYGLSNLWGLSRDKPDFITDAFYPELAQFGMVGVALYIWFWVFVLRKSHLRTLNYPSYQLFVMLIFIFFLIEGVADSTFTHNRGLLVLVILAMALTDIRHRYSETLHED